MSQRFTNKFSILDDESNDSYTPPSLRNKDKEIYMPISIKLENKKQDKVTDFPSLNSVIETNKECMTNKSVWGNNLKLSVIKDELRVSPILTNKELSSDKSMCECYYGECCKYMNKNIAKYHNKYGVNEYDRTKEVYYYIDTYYGHLAFSSPSKFSQMIDDMEANGEIPYFGQVEEEMIMDEY